MLAGTSSGPTLTPTYNNVTSSFVATLCANYSDGCGSCDNVTINIGAAPTVNISPSNIPICSGASATLTASCAGCTKFCLEQSARWNWYSCGKYK